MYAALELKSNIRVPPSLFSKDLKKAIKEAIEKEYVGLLTENGVFLALLDIKEIGEGKIIPEDGAVYYETVFTMLMYKPILHEVVDGFVTDITEFGAFIRVGPMDGLVHVSQVMDDYVNYAEPGVLQGKESKRVLKKKDNVRARIIAISLKNIKGAKLGLTMRQPGLGKIEWIEAEKKKEETAAVEEKKKKKK
ncbi:MAG: DNA-directed RNA polymerase [Nanoarchaeota archaeon]|nr:DNA-directed RNA polymerase [Nanoarchaeota archaeon]